MVKQSLCVGLQTCISERWTKDDYTDFTVVVEYVEFHCHRFILASCSTFFSLMFRNDMSETLSKKAVLKNISKEKFTIIINAIYLGQFDLTLDNVVEVWYAVHMLDIQYLLKECEDFISDNLSLKNYLQFYHHSRFLSSKNITSLTKKFILNNFQHLKTTETFLRFSYEDVVELLKDYNLNVSSENSVIDAILEWVKFDTTSTSLDKTMDQFDLISFGDTNEDILQTEAHNTSNNTSLGGTNNDSPENIRKQHLSSLLSVARVCLASEDYLEKLLVNPFVMADASALTIVKDALLYQWKSRCCSTALVNYRKCHGLCNVVAFVSDRNIFFIILEEKQLYSMFTLPENGYDNIRIAAEKDVLVLSRSDTSRVYYELFDETYTGLKKVGQTASHGPHVFLLRQRNFITVNKTNVYGLVLEAVRNPYGLQSFSISKSYSEDVTPEHAVIYKDNIIVFSSVKGDKNRIPSLSKVKTSVRVVKMDKSSVVKLKSLPGNPQHIVTFQVQDLMYVLQGEGQLWLIDNSGSTGITLIPVDKLWDFDWELRGAVWYSGTLFLFGPPHSALDGLLSVSLPGVFDEIQILRRNMQTGIVSMVVPRNKLPTQ